MNISNYSYNDFYKECLHLKAKNEKYINNINIDSNTEYEIIDNEKDSKYIHNTNDG